MSGDRRVPLPANEPVNAYAPGSLDRAELKSALDRLSSERHEIALVIDGKSVRTGKVSRAVMPFDHQHVLATWHGAQTTHVRQAIAAALRARNDWARTPFAERAAVFLKAAELLSTTWRAPLNAATMLGQAKTVPQAEIDSACELIDFWRFNVQFAAELMAEQPISSHAIWNALDYRPLEGFVYAITPFNFTAIAGNLPTAPAIMGNTVVWKPASSAVLSASYIMKLLEAAGLPPGVINFVPGPAADVSHTLLESPDFAGVHFTGSTDVFNGLWQTIGRTIGSYKTYPRLVGETGGKNFIIAHASADVDALAVAIVRGGFEYQGQKCSAPSRIYVPQSLWKPVRDRVVAFMDAITMGDVRDFRHFMSAVIDKKAFDRIKGYLTDAKRTSKIIKGGRSDDRTGYFIEPTLVQVTSPSHRLFREEVFGPVVAVYVYADSAWTATLDLVNRTSPYGLTGAVFARDRSAIHEASHHLRDAAGNFYINDKPTGAVVAQQPFGGARASGTNDKAGSKLNLTRWVSARATKETFVPPVDFRYPSMGEA